MANQDRGEYATCLGCKRRDLPRGHSCKRYCQRCGEGSSLQYYRDAPEWPHHVCPKLINTRMINLTSRFDELFQVMADQSTKIDYLLIKINLLETQQEEIRNMLMHGPNGPTFNAAKAEFTELAEKK